ncbi:hypothetical protein GCM10010307_38060 [Streptomyces vastus]|uniref:DUF3291 domain-containing protein n=1 Tax=Streptomyces vastus TaxID=285451 RepID=A0ABN3QZH3_9ACTN
MWRQVRRAPGAYGASLKAAPLRRTFWTLPALESPAALKAFARSGTHAPTVRGLGSQMLDAKFATWTVTTDDLPLDWPDALRRL